VTGALYRLGGWCARMHWPVVGIWLLVVIGLVVGSHAVADQLSDNLSLPGTGSTNATNVLSDKLPQQAYGTNPVVLHVAHGKLTDSANAQAVAAAASSLSKVPHVVKVVSPLSQQGAAFLSKDQTIGYIPVTLNVSPGDLTKGEAQDVLDAADPAKQAGMEVAVGGYVGKTLSKPSTEISELIGICAAIVILLFAFGTATAMAMPIVTALLGLVSTLSIVRLVGHAAEVPTIAPTLATMIGLGVGIDYALFIVTRHKQQLRGGMEVRESVARATATAGGAVAFAGGTVVIALCSLSLAGIPLVSTLGYTAAIAVVVAVLAATTLLPALLGALGPRIDSLRVQLGRTHPDDHQPHGWARWARGVARHPWPAIVGTTTLLLVLALPVLQLHLGQQDISAMPKSTTARQAYDLISEGFGPGANGPLLIAGRLEKPASSASDPRIAKLQQDIKQTKGVASVGPATLDKAGDTVVFTTTSTVDPADRKTEDLVNTLRDTTIPGAVKGTDLTVYVGGQTAGYIDLAKQIGGKLLEMIAVVVGLSFLVLLVAFRSLLVPLKAAVMNLLSVAAAYGVVTAVFQKGWGASLLGLDHSVPIISFVPLLMFAILFGLSMDYEVFLMTQIQERWKVTGNAKEAVVEGLASTGRVITSAALIMVFVFASFVLNGDPTVKQFGIGLAVAIALDATLVRCLLVPAVMELLGRAAWWLPHWLGRILPRINIEGEGWFAQRDAALAAASATQPSAAGAAQE
jgi:putative drug exporter of the RND superfamily